MGWQRSWTESDGTEVTEYGNYWYEDIGQWFMMLAIIAWAWVCLLLVAPWIWLYMKATGQGYVVRKTEQEIKAWNEQADLWNDRLERFTPPPGM